MAVTFSDDCRCVLIPELTDELRQTLYYTKYDIKRFKADSSRERKEARKLKKEAKERAAEAIRKLEEAEDSIGDMCHLIQKAKPLKEKTVSKNETSSHTKAPKSPTPTKRDKVIKSSNSSDTSSFKSKSSPKRDKPCVTSTKPKFTPITTSEPVKVQEYHEVIVVDVSCLPRRAIKIQSQAQNFIRTRLCI